MDFVLDGSTALRWCLKPQQTAYSDFILQLMPNADVVVPAIWPLEVANVISREVNKNIVTSADAADFSKSFDSSILMSLRSKKTL